MAVEADAYPRPGAERAAQPWNEDGTDRRDRLSAGAPRAISAF